MISLTIFTAFTVFLFKNYTFKDKPPDWIWVFGSGSLLHFQKKPNSYRKSDILK